MLLQQNLHRIASIFLFVIGAVSCGDSVAPGGTKTPTSIPVADLIGTYMLTKFDGQSLPAPFAADHQQDTVFAGCLVLGALVNPPASAAGTVNLTWLVNADAAATYLRAPAQCPPYFPAAYQEYDWYGSHGALVFCGTHSCSSTDFTAARVDGTMMISTGDPGHENVYVKQ